MNRHDDWLRRWRDDNIGFHRPTVHGALRQHWQPRTGRVLVPLCGKSLDLRWLAEQGHTVVGVELAERAIHDFFAEQQLTFDRSEGVLPAYAARELPITIHHGDYFAFAAVPPCDALYDRAALVALPPDLRPAYVAHTDSLLRGRPFRLVVTLEYDQALVPGPPFSVPADEVRRHWPDLELLDRRATPDETPPKFRAAGVSLVESVWRSPSR